MIEFVRTAIRRHDLLTYAGLACGVVPLAVGLRALATGLPVSFLLDPRKALAEAQGPCGARPQYVILNTSSNGDPINANVPGTYDDPNIVHSGDPAMAPTSLRLGVGSYTAAAPWASLPENVLSRLCFWHLMTDTPVHPKAPDVLRLMGAATKDEMLPSLLGRLLAPCLGTVQAQPVTIGASSPSEALTYGGRALPIIPALALRATLVSGHSALSTLQPLRDQTLARMYDLYRNGATKPQRAYIDSLVTSQQQVRGIEQSLLDSLASIKDNSIASQITAAIALVQMKVSPVVAIHIPFGGDNHSDAGLRTEAAQTVSGVAAIGTLMSGLDSAGLRDHVSFVSLNVFGRTLGPSTADGRQHNANHQVSLTIGSSFRAGVIGGVAPMAGDYGALAIDSTTGRGDPSGDVSASDSLASFGKSVLAGVGVDADSASSEIGRGRVIGAALA